MARHVSTRPSSNSTCSAADRTLSSMFGEFFDRLRAHQPQALIILAQFSIVVRIFNHLWWLEGWDHILLHAVDEALSTEDKKQYRWSLADMQRVLDKLGSQEPSGGVIS
jgi:hypothetical protein